MGYDAIHTSNYKFNGHLMSDGEIISAAINDQRIIITKDQDFADYFFKYGFPPKIWLIRTGNIKNDELIDFFSANLGKLFDLNINTAFIIISKKELIGY